MAARPVIEGLFGDVGPQATAAAPPAQATDGALAVGDQVRVKAGRNARATGEVIALEDVPTPGGFLAYVARIRRPRGGESWEFRANLERLP